MCGIAGYVDFANSTSSPDVLAIMVALLKHRGPDMDGIWADGPCGLAHTRLSVLDPSGGVQPMSLPNSNITLVYNGEIYNYNENRQKLALTGSSFRSTGDTEVLLRGLSWKWRSFLSDIEGMFAFGAWDRARDTLLLARDPLGEKPLFYSTPAPGVLVFGSEIKAVLAHPAVDRALDEDGLRSVLRFRAEYGEGTLHKGVKQIKPGSWMEFSKSGVTTGCFFDLVDGAARAGARHAGANDETLVQRGCDLFVSSVRRRLVADVPVGAYLSGGLDSSLVVAAMREARGPTEDIHTFSVGFEGDAHDELPFAKQVADHLRTRHHVVNVGPEAFARRWSELSAIRDSPLSEPAEVAFAELSRAAKPWVTVALSGEGADELFAGYPKYGFANAPPLIGAGLRAIGLRRASWIARRLPIDAARAANAFRALSHKTEAERLLQWFNDARRDDLRALLPGLDWSDEVWSRTMADPEASLSKAQSNTPLRRMQTLDCLTWLPGNILAYGDRMSMAEGLELRLPYLDKTLAAFSLSLPDSLKIRRGTQKWIMRQWRIGELPAEILNRRKWGFRVPLAHWFRGPLRSMMLDYLSNPAGICGRYGDPKILQSLIKSHLSESVDASATLWKLLSTEIWFQDVYLSDA